MAAKDVAYLHKFQECSHLVPIAVSNSNGKAKKGFNYSSSGSDHWSEEARVIPYGYYSYANGLGHPPEHL